MGDLPLHMQVKLLRVIEEKNIWAVGSTKPVQIDARIIASTNRDLVKEIEAARFREDLFYRLNVVHIALPPLRERRGEIPLPVGGFCLGVNVEVATEFLGRNTVGLKVPSKTCLKGHNPAV